MILADDLMALPFGGIELDRSAHLRKDVRAIRSFWLDGQSRVVLVGDQHEIVCCSDGTLDWRSPIDTGAFDENAAIFLGRSPEGVALFALSVENCNGEHLNLVNLRDIALGLTSVEQSALALAVALVGWHRRSRFCARCGGPTTFGESGHIRFCSACDRDIFPRSDAAVIMLVSAGEHCVLGRRLGSEPHRWSTLAGFVEAGESPEAAVFREVREEVGLQVESLRYRGGQPWPFPASLMLAYEAHSSHLELTPNEEHLEVRWFHRREVEHGLVSGKFAVPSRLSAGGHLISDWLSGGPS